MLHQCGYRDVPGVDPFAQPGPFAQQGTIEDAEGKFDLFFFSDSLAESYAWRVYGTNWFGLESPRYLTVPTGDGIRIVAQRAGLRVVKAVADSSALQFWASELYRRGIPFTRITVSPTSGSSLATRGRESESAERRQ